MRLENAVRTNYRDGRNNVILSLDSATLKPYDVGVKETRRDNAMDMWKATDEQIRKAAERKTGQPVVAIYRGTGLWVDVELANGQFATVYAHDIR